MCIRDRQELVGFDGAIGADTQFFNTVAFEVGGAADGNEYGIEGDAHLLALVFGDQDFLAALDKELFRRVTDPHIDTLGAEALHDLFGNFRVFAHQQARQHFHLGNRGAEAGESLRQLRANRATAKNDEPFR